jgi:hypothetical protein
MLVMDFSVVTTFNTAGRDLYGHRMISTWLQHWPVEAQLWVYAEGCEVSQRAANLHVQDLATASSALTAFKQQWQHVPRANGDVSDDPGRSGRKDSGKGFKWDAVRFAHKVYAIFACAKQCRSDWLLWMDADMVCHSPVTIADLERLCPADRDICYLGRRGKYSECGLYAMNLRSNRTQAFLDEFQRMYDQAESGIFELAEWHDSFVFDAVRERMPLRCLDWSSNLGDLRASSHVSQGEGHPLINSEWGRWLDHLKGDRKQQGRSRAKDLRVVRNEAYWRA